MRSDRSRKALPLRERVFMESLMYHGYRYTSRRHRFKKQYGYIIPSTMREDSGGVDFWIKLPGSEGAHLLAVQVTQRGSAIFRRKHPHCSEIQWREFLARSEERLRRKRTACRRSNVAYVLVGDWLGGKTNKDLAWRDVKALRFAVQQMKKRV